MASGQALPIAHLGGVLLDLVHGDAARVGSQEVQQGLRLGRGPAAVERGARVGGRHQQRPGCLPQAVIWILPRAIAASGTLTGALTTAKHPDTITKSTHALAAV